MKRRIMDNYANIIGIKYDIDDYHNLTVADYDHIDTLITLYLNELATSYDAMQGRNFYKIYHVEGWLDPYGFEIDDFIKFLKYYDNRVRVSVNGIYIRISIKI